MSITELLNELGPGTGEVRILPPDDTGRVWCEIELPLDRYSVSLVTDFAFDAANAIEWTVAKAKTFRRAEERKAA